MKHNTLFRAGKTYKYHYSNGKSLSKLELCNDRIMITGLVFPQNTTVPQNTTQDEYPWLI